MHYTKDDYFIASGIRNFKPPLLKTYRSYLQHKKHRVSLDNIINNLKQKGYSFPDQKFKRVPREFLDIKDDEHIYLTKYGAMFGFKEFKIDDIFFSQELLDRCFKIYEDLHPLQQWVYEMTLTHKE
jgi:hypothetical protein